MIFAETVILNLDFEEAVDKVKNAFAREGFGILTEIDIQATMKQKLDKDMQKYVILGACNPDLASRALDVEPQIGVLLPCNVVLREDAPDVIVEAMDPGLMGNLVDGGDIHAIADEARELISNALTSLGA